LEGWKVGRLEGWKVGRLEGLKKFVSLRIKQPPNIQTFQHPNRTNPQTFQHPNRTNRVNLEQDYQQEIVKSVNFF
jgi:hypothetical protein